MTTQQVGYTVPNNGTVYSGGPIYYSQPTYSTSGRRGLFRR
jgi:hypothetical protein